MITIDGSEGEGGGQIVRSALSLSLLTGQPFRIKNVRAGRKKPGLLRQHLTAVEACTHISASSSLGAEIGSQELTFSPGKIKGGNYTFSIGSAGSTTLVLQTILLPLLLADAPSHVTLEGGTHNPWSPPFDFVQQSFLPLLSSMGIPVSCTLDRPGFYPAGGGRLTIDVVPCKNFKQLSLTTRGDLLHKGARSLVAGLSGEIAKRELKAARKVLEWPEEEFKIEQLPNEYGPGNIFFIEMAFQHIVEVLSAFGEKGVSAEEVGESAAKSAMKYLSHSAPVSQHLADQLLLPCIWADGGEFVTEELSQHFKTNAGLIEKFSPYRILTKNIADGCEHVTITRK